MSHHCYERYALGWRALQKEAWRIGKSILGNHTEISAE